MTQEVVSVEVEVEVDAMGRGDRGQIDILYGMMERLRASRVTRAKISTATTISDMMRRTTKT